MTGSLSYNTPAEDYFAIPALSKSGATDLLRSPAHFLARRDRPMVPTAAMLFGTLVHSMVLEPESVDVLYLASPKFDRRTKAGKEALAEFEAQAEGKVVVDMDTFQRAQRTAEAVLTHPTAGPLFKGGNAEITARWEQHGLPCKARVDYYQGRSIVDLKTTQDASPDEFARSCARYGYHLQAAHYSDGMGRLDEKHLDGFIFVGVESASPHGVGVYTLDKAALDEGRRQMALAADLYRRALDEQSWKGYPTEMQQLSLPGWAAPRRDIL
jgi:hypothetical protein